MDNQLTVSTASATELMLNTNAMQAMDMMAGAMASSAVTVPKHLQGNKSDCLAVVMQAAQWGMNPFAVAQKTHLVNGNLGYEAQLVNAVISSSRAIIGRFKYEFSDWSGPDGFVRVGAVLAGESEITWGEWLDTKAVKTKNSPLWKSAPKQQAAYLAVKYWARLYCPEVILGVYSADEFDDQPVQERDITPKTQTGSSSLDALIEQHQQQPEQQADAAEDSADNSDADNYAASKFIDQMDLAQSGSELATTFETAWKHFSGKPDWRSTVQASYEENKARLLEA